MPNVSLPAYETATARGRTHPIVVGFSVRSLAEAVVALGYSPVAVDHFTDHDCRELSLEAYQIVSWGDGTPQIDELVRQFGARSDNAARTPVLLGGGTENWPELIEELHRNFKVLGPTLAQVKQLRSHDFWRVAVDGTGILFPETRMEPPVIANNGNCLVDPSKSWLTKPIHGAGGLAIGRLDNQISARRASEWGGSSPPQVYQREIVGRSLGGHCILTPDDVLLLGLTESWSAAHWPGPREFIYRGSWGPISISAQQREQIVSLCRKVQSATGCLGWLQFDFIEDSSGQLWLLEINPRWTAGMEILFLAGINPVQFHCAAWQMQNEPAVGIKTPGTTTQATVDQSLSTASLNAKAIVYADRPLQLTRDNLLRLQALPRDNFADLPSIEMAGQVIATGHPLLTVRACFESAPTFRRRLTTQARASLLQQLHQHRQTAIRSVDL